MANFTRGFRLHLPDGRTLDGAEFPSGRCVVENLEHDIWLAALSVDVLTEESFPGARIEWAADSSRT